MMSISNTFRKFSVVW